MITIEIVPYERIGPARLGMHWDEVPGVLGTPCHNRVKEHKQEVYWEAALVLSYDDEGIVDNIVVTNSAMEIGYRPLLFSQNPLELMDDDLLKYLAQFGHYDVSDPELGYSYIYKDIGIYLWRDSDPKQLIKEMNDLNPSAPEYATDLIFYQEELRKKRYFECAGIFLAGHFD